MSLFSSKIIISKNFKASFNSKNTKYIFLIEINFIEIFFIEKNLLLLVIFVFKISKLSMQIYIQNDMCNKELLIERILENESLKSFFLEFNLK